MVRSQQVLWLFVTLHTSGGFSPLVRRTLSPSGLTIRQAVSTKQSLQEVELITTPRSDHSGGLLFDSLRTKHHNGDTSVTESSHGVLTESLLQQDGIAELRQQKREMDPQKFVGPLIALVMAAGFGTAAHYGITPSDIVHTVEAFVANPQATLNSVVEAVERMGPAGPLYFGLFYLLAEVLAVPATPLTMSAGYLFGLAQGTSIVLTAATVAASIAFVVGKTFLRSWVEGLLDENPDFRKLDKAIGKQGFKLLVLVRLSPIFPFALSNYVYGASSIDFASYFWGTLIGFAPGTIAYVYTGMVGKELLSGDGQPLYVYAAGFGLLLGFLKLATDVASGIVESIDDDDDETSAFR